MSSNQKPPAKLQAPNEPFKRAVAGCMRSLAKMPAIEVAFTGERPSLVWTGAIAKAGLPEPSVSYWPLILTLTVLFFIAALLVLYFALKH